MVYEQNLVLNAQGYSYQAGLWLGLVVAPEVVEGGRVQQSAKSLWRAGLWLAHVLSHLDEELMATGPVHLAVHPAVHLLPQL